MEKIENNEVVDLLNKISKETQDTFGDNFLGLYVHGSVVMNCFNPKQSDVDFLIVVKNKISVEDKKKLASILVNQEYSFEKGIEMSVVTKDNTKNPTFPTPYELHFGKELIGEYINGDFDFEKERTDPDLPAHFMVVNKRGITFSGLAKEEVFGEVSRDMYLQSLMYDFGEFEENMENNPVYAILNACRTLAFVNGGLVLSKKEGGEWGLKNLDESYTQIIEQAMTSYDGINRFDFSDEKVLEQFTQEMVTKIKV